MGAAVILFASSGIAIWLIGVLPLRARYEGQSRALDVAIADFHQQRWVRPVLRGELRDGNAYAAQLSAIGPLRGLPSEALSDAMERMHDGEPPAQEMLSLIEEHRVHLARYRAATAHRWTWGDYAVEDGISAVELDYTPHIAATRLLTLMASTASPDECLRIGADIIRLGQDRATGRSMIGLMIHDVGVREIFDRFAQCVLEAEPEHVRRVASELAILVEHPAPMGYAMEVEAYYAGATIAQELRPLLQLPSSGREFEIWWGASDSLEAWAALADDPVARRQIGEDYPDDIARYERWAAGLAASANPLLSIGAPQLGRFLRRNASTRTRVRMLWALARLRSGEPRTVFLDPLLRDPLTGDPLQTHETSAGLEIQSPGEDGASGAGDEESDDLALRLPAN